MRNKKGFTLIELLAVIIILGILMIIAVPAVTKYINDSKESAYIKTAKSMVNGAKILVNSEKINFDDLDTTYYIDGNCIKAENEYRSPYGEFEKAYVAVTTTYDGHEYYWTSVDETGIGVRSLINIEKLDIEHIESGIDKEEITTDRGLDNRSKVVVVDSNCQKGESTERMGANINSLNGEEIVCKKVTDVSKLHTKTCESTTDGCASTIGNGNPITYGTIVNGELKAGDALDCKVSNDGDYSERFYYVKSDGDNSILIYYKNMNNQATIAYDSSNENWHGPRTAYQYLPSTNEWNNTGILAPGTRSIVADNGSSSTTGGTIESFAYTGKAARFLTFQELKTACGLGVPSTIGYLNNCAWLMENVEQYETESGSYGYWLETPSGSSASAARDIKGDENHVYGNVANSLNYGVRPAITVKTENIR